MWYEDNILGNSFKKYHDIYYYPMESKYYNFLVIAIDKKYKSDIINISKKIGYNLLYVSVDVFSAAICAKQILRIKKDEDFSIWKICKNNFNYFSYYKKNNLAAFIKFKIKNGNLIFNQKIGDLETIKYLSNYIKDVIIDNKESDFKSRIILYQTKSDFNYIKTIINKNKNLEFLDMAHLFDDNKVNKFKIMPYIENGFSLRGVDV